MKKTINYQIKECECKNLRKIAPMWFYCTDCGRVFYFMLSMQFSFEEAVKHWGGIIESLDKVKNAVRRAEKKRAKIEERAEKEAVKEYKASLNKKNEA